MILMIFWRFVSDYADLASVAGLLLSLIGFYLTISSARAARRAAERAQESVSRMRSQLLANELGKIIQCLRDLNQTIRSGKSRAKAIQLSEESQVQLARNSSGIEFTAEERADQRNS